MIDPTFLTNAQYLLSPISSTHLPLNRRFYTTTTKPDSFSMSPPDPATITDLLTRGPHRLEVGRKQLTLAFGGIYIASTTALAKSVLVWETEKGYPRYYVPTESLHDDIKSHLTGFNSDHGKANGHKSSGSSVDVVEVDTVRGKGNDSQAIIERLTVGSKTTTWVRFVEGPLKGFVRFERSEIGRQPFPSPCHSSLRNFKRPIWSDNPDDLLTY